MSKTLKDIVTATSDPNSVISTDDWAGRYEGELLHEVLLTETPWRLFGGKVIDFELTAKFDRMKRSIRSMRDPTASNGVVLTDDTETTNTLMHSWLQRIGRLDKNARQDAYGVIASDFDCYELVHGELVNAFVGAWVGDMTAGWLDDVQSPNDFAGAERSMFLDMVHKGASLHSFAAVTTQRPEFKAMLEHGPEVVADASIIMGFDVQRALLTKNPHVSPPDYTAAMALAKSSTQFDASNTDHLVLLDKVLNMWIEPYDYKQAMDYGPTGKLMSVPEVVNIGRIIAGEHSDAELHVHVGHMYIQSMKILCDFLWANRYDMNDFNASVKRHVTTGNDVRLSEGKRRLFIKDVHTDFPVVMPGEMQLAHGPYIINAGIAWDLLYNDKPFIAFDTALNGLLEQLPVEWPDTPTTTLSNMYNEFDLKSLFASHRFANAYRNIRYAQNEVLNQIIDHLPNPTTAAVSVALIGVTHAARQTAMVIYGSDVKASDEMVRKMRIAQAGVAVVSSYVKSLLTLKPSGFGKSVIGASIYVANEVLYKYEWIYDWSFRVMAANAYERALNGCASILTTATDEAWQTAYDVADAIYTTTAVTVKRVTDNMSAVGDSFMRTFAGIPGAIMNASSSILGMVFLGTAAAVLIEQWKRQNSK